MNFLNAQQLAFILDIKKEDARAKMCAAWEKAHGIKRDSNALGFEKVKDAKWNSKNKIEDPYPQAMPINIIAEGLNMPTLESMFLDIRENYLKRPASKRWILATYPEKVIKKAEEEGKKFPVKIAIPPALKSLLPTQAQRDIFNYWKSYKTADNITDRFIIDGLKEAFNG